MAARENQGLQITLIIFVMLAIILSVTTFIFYNNYKEQLANAKGSEDQARQASENLRTLQEERNALATTLGFPVTDKKEDIEAKTNAEVTKYAGFFSKDVPDNQRNYSTLVDALAKTIDAKNQELEKAKLALDDLNKLLHDTEAKWAQVVKAHGEAKAKAEELERANQESYTSQIAQLTNTTKQAQGQLAQKERDYQTLMAKAEGELKKLQDELKRAQDTVQTKQGLIEGLTQAAPTVPDGRIAWVSQRDDTVFINVGSDDGLQRRISFSVYDRDATDATKAVKKGSIEVLNVRGPHLAEARIMESTNSDPMVPGDIIYTPIWDPGQTQHFAIAGFIDFDHDGVSDRTKLKDLISHNGGIVDVEMDEKGTVTGQMSNRTQHLILGEPPSEKAAEAVTRAFTQIYGEAKSSGVPSIKLDAFLAQIGYTARTGGAADANTSGPRSLRAPTETPDRTGTSGQGFRERRPPSSNGKSAF